MAHFFTTLFGSLYHDHLQEADQERIGLEISNGNGINRIARRVGEYLSRKGFHIVCLTNAVPYNYRETVVYYREGYLHAAYEVAKQIPRYQNMEKVPSFDDPQIVIKVILGKDMIAWDRKHLFAAFASLDRES